jgi:hypothetical protein
VTGNVPWWWRRWSVVAILQAALNNVAVSGWWRRAQRPKARRPVAVLLSTAGGLILNPMPLRFRCWPSRWSL